MEAKKCAITHWEHEKQVSTVATPVWLEWFLNWFFLQIPETDSPWTFQKSLIKNWKNKSLKTWTKKNLLSPTYADPMTTKSMMFHTFRRYALVCSTRPRAMILQNASTQKMVKKIGSAFSSSIDNSVRSLLGKCSSIAIVTHDETIVIKMVYSNGGHSIRNFMKRRNRFVSLKTNKDAGPGGFSAELCADTTFTLTFWCEFTVVACVSTFGPPFASCAAVLMIPTIHFWMISAIKGKLLKNERNSMD